MTREPLVSIRLTTEHVNDRAAWAEGLVVQLPQSTAEILTSGERGDGFRQMTEAAALDLRSRAAFIARPPASGRLPIHYHAIPARVRRVLASAIGHLQRRRSATWAKFPAWPLDLSADACADLGQDAPCRHATTPVLLTHDLDSPEGLRNAVSLFLPIEEAAGGRSANYIVPCSWPIDEAFLGEIRDRGHEVGIHGYDHANRTAFAEPDELKRRLAAGWAFGQRYGVAGYRAPSLVRNEALLGELARYYAYDSSIPTSGGPFPVFNNGCASARPWRVGSLWELPITLPRDGSLRFLGYDPEAIYRSWTQAADRIARSGGIVNLLTHCEAGFSGNEAMLSIYRRFVEWVAQDGRFQFVLPRDLVGRLAATPDGVAIG